MKRACAHLLGLCLLFAFAPAAAQTPDTVRAVVHEFLRGQTAGQPGAVRIEVATPQLPPQLAPCAQVEPWLPSGARAWGRVRVGVRCADGASWSLYVGATVRVTGDYLVSARALRPGDILTRGDIATRRGELTAMGRQLLTDPAQAEGSQMRFAVGAGQPLRATMLAQPIVVRAGSPVKVVVSGDGFSAANQGTALSNGRAGAAVRVRLRTGRVIQGVATVQGEVHVDP